MNLSIKKLFTILLVILIVSSLALALTACKDEPTLPPDEEEIIVTPVEDILIIKNGSFINTTGTTYPLAPTSWSGAAGSPSGAQATPTGADNLISGVISVEETLYNQNKNLWGDLNNPGKQGEDNNVLMIYNKVNTAFKYTNSFSAAAGKHYKVSIPVKTILTEGKGAYIYLTGGAYAAFEAISTNNIWTTYTVYIEASLISSENITITLALGFGALDSGNMSQGFAFFDEVKAEEITATQYKDHTVSSTSSKYTLRVPDSRMDYFTGTTTPATPYGYSSKTGTGAGGTAPYYSTDIAKGIVDTSAWNEIYGVNPGNPVPDTGNKLLMINNKNATSSGYAGNRKIRFGISGYYELSVDVYVKLAAEHTNTEFKGATIALTGTDSFKIKYIDTNGTWVRYSFFIEANQVRDKDFTLELWLGEGGKDDTDTLTKGIAFFDNVMLVPITSATYTAQETARDLDPDNYPNYVASLASTNANLISNNNLDNIDINTGLPVGWAKETSSTTVIYGDNDVKYASIPEAELNAVEWTTELKDKYSLDSNPLTPYSTMAPVFMINNTIPTVSGMGLVNEVQFKSNLHYRLAIWLKTVDIAEGKGIDIKLITGTGTDKKTLSSFSTINTATHTNIYANDYLEIVFLIQGHELTDKSARVVIEMGSGTQFDPTKYILGSALIANVNMEQVTHTEYNSASATSFVKKYSYTESTSTITNGNFNKLDLSKTEVDANGKLTTKPGVPESWTASTSTEKNVIAGIVDTTNSGLLTALGLSDIYNTDGWTLPYPVDFGSPNLLMIESAIAAGEFDGKIKPYGYASNSFTLSSSSYYIIKAYVKTIFDDVDAVASIFLTPTTTNTSQDNYTNIKTNGKWEEYIFVVATGKNSVSTKLELYLGNKGSNTEIAGTVLFDSVSYQTIDKDQFEAYTNDNRIISLSYQIETFDNVKSSSTGLPTPNNWTGVLGNTSLPTGATNLIHGVHSYISGDVTDLGVKDEAGNLIPASKIDNDTIRDIIFGVTLQDTIIGDNVLMINNKVPTAFSYKTSTAETLLRNSYYEVSVWVFTYYIGDKSARVMLSIGEDTFTFKNVNNSYVDGAETTGTWTKYSYYIKTAETANASSNLTLGLGRYLVSDTNNEGLVSGYAFFDNYVVNTVDKTVFDQKKAAQDLAKTETATVEQKAFMNTNSVILIDEPEQSIPSDPTDPDPDEPTTPKVDFPWLLVSSAIIGGVIVLAMLAVIIKKIAPKIAARRKLRFKKTNYDRTTSKDKTTTKSNRYDKYKD